MSVYGEKIIFEKRYRLLRHLLFWAVYLFFFSFLSSFDLESYPKGVLTALMNAPVVILYTYVILGWMVPRFLVTGRYLTFFILYCIWAIAGMVLNFLFRYYILFPFRGGLRPSINGHINYKNVFALFSFVVMNMVVMFAVFIRMFKSWSWEQQQKLQMEKEKDRIEKEKIQVEKEKVTAELELLKAQLHPHFLFNTLNNLYALVLDRSDKAPDMLLRLSALLNYVLYECKSSEVPLEKEVRLIRDYVALEQQRYGDRLDVSMTFLGDIEGRNIAPMLFQPFVENAFKHGPAEQLGKVWMSIELSVQHNQLFFQVINGTPSIPAPPAPGTYPPPPPETYPTPSPIGPPEPPSGGIGISNVRRRLGLLYPGQHTLSNQLQDDVYVVSLTLSIPHFPPSIRLKDEHSLPDRG
jgi:hypothetical protein